MFQRCRRQVGGLALGLSLWGIPVEAQASQEAAKRYFQNGVDLITAAQPNYQDAYYQFQLAYKESDQSWKVLGNLGLCALKLERDEEAAAYYEAYLLRGGSEIAPEERTAIEQDMLLLKGNLATLHLTSRVPELTVVDRRSGSQAPAQSYALKGGSLNLKLRAGSHNLTASNGQRSASWDVVLQPGQEASHEFDFDAPADGPSANATPRSQPEPARDSGAGGGGLRIPAYVTIGAGAVVAGLGGFFLWRSSDYGDQAAAAFECNAMPGGCTAPQRTRVRELESDRDSARTMAIVGFGVGGAAIVTGVIMLVADRGGSSASAQKASVTPWVGWSSAGLSGQF